MNRIKELRKFNNLIQKDVAKEFNIAESTYSYWESGKHEPDLQTAIKLADYFKVSVDYLLGRESDFYAYDNIRPIAVQSIPLLGSISCGKPIFANEERESYVLAGTGVKADFCLVAKGDSMIGARIQDGDVVFIRRQEEVEHGEIAAVVIGDEATLKRVYYYKEKNKIVLQAENPKYEPLVYENGDLDDVLILGKAVAFQSDLN